MTDRGWMVRAGDENELFEDFVDNGYVAIGWDDLGDLSDTASREQVKDRYHEVYQEDSERRRNVNAGQVYRFVHEIEEGDWILTYNQAKRIYQIGRCTGGYRYNNAGKFPEYPHQRPIQWIQSINRDHLSHPAKNSLGSTLTIFRLDAHIEELEVFAHDPDSLNLPPERIAVGKEEEETPPYHEEVESTADEMIADIISDLDAYDFQDLVAAVLRAMGFKARSVGKGPDGGVDIIAHPDALGFEQPRIKVQVKHKNQAIGAPEVRAFIGVLQQGDKGLFVSTGDFTTQAKREAGTGAQPLTLLNRSAFIDLLLENYEKLDPEFQAQVPLRKVWIPAAG